MATNRGSDVLALLGRTLGRRMPWLVHLGLLVALAGVGWLLAGPYEPPLSDKAAFADETFYGAWQLVYWGSFVTFGLYTVLAQVFGRAKVGHFLLALLIAPFAFMVLNLTVSIAFPKLPDFISAQFDQVKQRRARSALTLERWWSRIDEHRELEIGVVVRVEHECTVVFSASVTPGVGAEPGQAARGRDATPQSAPATPSAPVTLRCRFSAPASPEFVNLVLRCGTVEQVYSSSLVNSSFDESRGRLYLPLPSPSAPPP
jgi:hypothetical protein